MPEEAKQPPPEYYEFIPALLEADRLAALSSPEVRLAQLELFE
jgi:hypothetical protein